MCIFSNKKNNKSKKKVKVYENKCLSCGKKFNDYEIHEYDEDGQPCCPYCRSNRTTPNK